MTTLIILAVTLPLLIFYFRRKNMNFDVLVFLCGSIFFMFGYHVHEKAIAPYIGLLMVFYSQKQEKNNYLDCAVFVNIINLLPLLIAPNEKMFRIVAPFIWIAIWERKRFIESTVEIVIVTAAIGILAFQEFLHPLLGLLLFGSPSGKEKDSSNPQSKLL